MMNKEDIGSKLNAAANAINKMEDAKPNPLSPSKPDSLSTRFGKFMSMHPELVVNKNGKQYLRAEAWQFLASQVGFIPSCDCLSMVHKGEDGIDKLVGVKVEVSLNDKRTGQTFSRSMMVAMCDEEWLKGKSEYAVYGLAQTRAISRAIRNVYGWVAAQAGFETVPLEEIQ